MNYMFESYYSAEYPVMEVFCRPGIMLREGADVYKLCRFGGWDELSTRIYADLNIHYIGRRGKSSDMLISRVPVEHVEDLKGMKIRMSGVIAKGLDYLGASTVFISPDEMYTALSSGLVDGTDMSSIEEGIPTGYYEIAKYVVVPPLARVNTTVMVANMDFWNTLSEADKALMEQIFYYITGVVLPMKEEYNDTILKEQVIKDYGITFNYWDDEDQEKWGEALVASFDQFPDDPDWAEAWQLMEDYCKQMGYIS
jgi:TRAP-type C4-dicarboxylate transport system substrate-binding protein